MERPLGICVVTARSVGIRLIEGILASTARLDGRINLALAIGLPTSRLRDIPGGRCVAGFGREYGLRCRIVRDASLKSSASTFHRLGIDLVLVAGWPFRISSTALGTGGTSFVGFHPRALPEGRGRSPIPWILHGTEPVTYLTLFEITDSMDAGPVVLSVPLEVRANEDATSLYQRFCQAHFDFGMRIENFLNEELEPIEQMEASAVTWPSISESMRNLSEDMTQGEMRRTLRAHSPPFLAPVWGNARVDARSSLSGFPAREGLRSAIMHCADGDVQIWLSPEGRR
jgi:folate-dependent phosphoribosylglycinamide formyltransferase PurN